MITIISYSLQLSGALILLISSVQKGRNVIEDESTRNIYALIVEDCKFTIYKDDLQKTAKKRYKEICSFADLAAGYALAVFRDNSEIKLCYRLILLLFFTAVLMLVETRASKFFAERKYNDDKIKDIDDLPHKKGRVVFCKSRKDIEKEILSLKAENPVKDADAVGNGLDCSGKAAETKDTMARPK